MKGGASNHRRMCREPLVYGVSVYKVAAWDWSVGSQWRMPDGHRSPLTWHDVDDIVDQDVAYSAIDIIPW